MNKFPSLPGYRKHSTIDGTQLDHGAEESLHHCIDRDRTPTNTHGPISDHMSGRSTATGECATFSAQETLTFALKWRHWGGGEDEEIFIHFGVDSFRYFQRVRKLLSTPAARYLSPEEKAHLREICACRSRSD
jgi:hypothetical protein